MEKTSRLQRRRAAGWRNQPVSVDDGRFSGDHAPPDRDNGLPMDTTAPLPGTTCRWMRKTACLRRRRAVGWRNQPVSVDDGRFSGDNAPPDRDNGLPMDTTARLPGTTCRWMRKTACLRSRRAVGWRNQPVSVDDGRFSGYDAPPDRDNGPPIDTMSRCPEMTRRRMETTQSRLATTSAFVTNIITFTALPSSASLIRWIEPC
jgi:hypothetical protein